jgi:hypothetical protein
MYKKDDGDNDGRTERSTVYLKMPILMIKVFINLERYENYFMNKYFLFFF